MWLTIVTFVMLLAYSYYSDFNILFIASVTAYIDFAVQYNFYQLTINFKILVLIFIPYYISIILNSWFNLYIVCLNWCFWVLCSLCINHNWLHINLIITQYLTDSFYLIHESGAKILLMLGTHFIMQVKKK